MDDKSKLCCSFCTKNASSVKKLIAGPEVHICNECVDKCHAILTNTKKTTASKTPSTAHKPLAPREIKEFLDQYVIGQDYAKEVLSVAVYNHYKRLENPVIDGVEIDRTNCLICGPSGSGKTLLLQTISRFLDIPFVSVDATSLTEAGYVGEDVESIIGRLLGAANNDVSRAERGIVFIDELDKKRSGGSSGTHSRDISGEGVQQALLKMLDGSDILVAPVGVKKTPSTEMIRINTKQILFIVGGAFVGLEKIVEQTLNANTGIGFTAEAVEKKEYTTLSLLQKVEPEHLIKFGLIPELVGRLPVIAPLSELNEDQLVRVLSEPKNALVKQFIAMFGLDGIELEFTDDALLAVAKIAKHRKTNGRALRSVLETKLTRTQFRLPDLRDKSVSKIIVDAAVINSDAEPKFIFKSETKTN